ncbi:NAD(P)H-hydrate dehydratase, partial [Salmonella enterica]|uniref:NAD(P)H-hydrate dehydratase n=1 Tax=Salmonella enterica TaxID=28901 RepID=UPI003D2DEEDF
AFLIGPGHGVNDRTRGFVMAALATGKPCVLDADALTVFQEEPSALFAAIRGPCILTPHDGEFARLFDARGDKPARARRAAAAS